MLPLARVTKTKLTRHNKFDLKINEIHAIILLLRHSVRANLHRVYIKTANFKMLIIIIIVVVYIRALDKKTQTLTQTLL